MSTSSQAASASMGSSLGVERQAGGPAMLRAEAADPPGWAAEYRDALRGAVVEQGAVLVRGLGLTDPDTAGSVFRALATGLMAEQEAFAPRRVYAEHLYSATAWPANQQMCMHHELSYRLSFPGLMLFACLTAPASGGATPVADAEAVLRALPAGLAARFEDEGWLLTRNYNDEIGASYAEAFGTEDRTAVEAYCRANAIEFAWQPDGGLRTRQRRPAVVRHPVTGRRCWFNQIAFLNEWTMDRDVRDFLVEAYGPQGLPFTTLFGNGEPVGPAIVDLVGEVYAAHTMREAWRPGDLLLVDNLRCAHSREAFEGQREILVGMAEPMRLPLPSPLRGPGRTA